MQKGRKKIIEIIEQKNVGKVKWMKAANNERMEENEYKKTKNGKKNDMQIQAKSDGIFRVKYVFPSLFFYSFCVFFCSFLTAASQFLVSCLPCIR